MITKQQILKMRKLLNGSERREVFKLLSDTNRYHIVQILVEFSKVKVSNFSKILNISIPLTSQHLKILERGRMLEKERHGQNVYYKFKKDNAVARSIIKEII